MKKITLDNNCKQDIIEKFTKFINNTRFTNETLSFTTDISENINTKDYPAPTVYISSVAYLKMLLYVRDTDVEIAWHGVVERNKEQNWYYIKDVFLYPQIIAATTVNTDQEAYQNWLQDIDDDEVFNNIRFQGHSHVNMATFASGTDQHMYESFLQALPKDDYYIFMIMNKAGSIHSLIYDLDKNLLYENADISVKVVTTRTKDLLKDITDEKTKYCTNTQIQHRPFGTYPRYSNPFDDYDMSYNPNTSSYTQNKYRTPSQKYQNPKSLHNTKGKKS